MSEYMVKFENALYLQKIFYLHPSIFIEIDQTNEEKSASVYRISKMKFASLRVLYHWKSGLSQHGLSILTNRKYFLFMEYLRN